MNFLLILLAMLSGLPGTIAAARGGPAVEQTQSVAIAARIVAAPRIAAHAVLIPSIVGPAAVTAPLGFALPVTIAFDRRLQSGRSLE